MTALRVLLRKEVMELYLSKGQPRLALVVNVVLALLVGIVIPLLAGLAHARGGGGSAWARVMDAGSGVLAVSAFVALLGAMPGSSEAFAGERERHTLPTLLAMPVRRGTLLAAKTVAQLAAVWLAAGVAGLAFLATATIAFGVEGLVVGLFLVPVILLVSTVAALGMMGLAMMVSAKAETTKQAQQTLGFALMPVFLLPVFLGPLLSSMAGAPLVAVVTVLAVLPVLALLLGGLGWMVAWHRSRRSYLVSV